ncbi:hypothetical protein [Gulosibacter sediminis]|uniref:hypothetical protein n=1 Tax=Gulosibacter sediminis TaxID=1729695 RepID=UPI0024A7DC0B|nr:hypothetical protein [Gulosibacter sediminis]
MSNQFPPSGYGDRESGQPDRDAQQVFGGGSDYNSSGNDYNSYGSYGDSNSSGNDYNSYSSGGDQYASQGDSYASQGEQYASQGDGFGQQNQQQVYGGGQYGGDQQQYGQQNQQQYQPQSAAAYGGYGSSHGGQPGGGAPKKKGIPVWAWIVIAVAAVALVGGGIWGGIALFGGGNSNQTTANGGNGTSTSGNSGDSGDGGEAPADAAYPIDNTDEVSDIALDYTGDWDPQDLNGQELFYSPDQTCTYLTSFVPAAASGGTWYPDDPAGSLNTYLNTDTTGYQLSNAGSTTVTDTNGLEVELGTVLFTEDTYDTTGLLTAHVFGDDLLMYQITCFDREPSASELDELIAQTETTITE